MGYAHRTVVLAGLAAVALGEGILWHCEAKTCEFVCADCPTSCNTGEVDCGDPTLGDEGDKKWAEVGRCYRYTDDLDCDYRTHIQGPVTCTVLGSFALLFLMWFPCLRCWCNWCGGDSVDTDQCCYGNPKGQCFTCGPDAVAWEEERMLAMDYFESGDTCECDVANPYHPCGARFFWPSVLVVLGTVCLILTVTGVGEVETAFDDMFAAGHASVAATLGGNVDNASVSLAASSSCLTSGGQTYAQAGIQFDTQLAEMRRITQIADTEFNEVKTDAGFAKSSILGVAWSVGVTCLPIGVAILAMGIFRCSRLGPCPVAGVVSNWLMMVVTVLCLMYAWLLLGTVVYSAIAMAHFCEEVDEAVVSPPNMTGVLAGKSLHNVCRPQDYAAQITAIRVEQNRSGMAPSSCAAFVDAIDVLAGNPRRNGGYGRGGVYEGVSSCRRLVREVGLSFKPHCRDLEAGFKTLIGAAGTEVVSMLLAVLVVWLGFKRWIREDDVDDTWEERQEEMQEADSGPAHTEPCDTEPAHT
eukprot:Hpha_TRINITY_DN8788_c0_g1::TRINITY_DN8788_c0_g1_i1::g.45376::m.45376